MSLRSTALLALVALAGCQWSGRPDGASANHSNRDGYPDDALGSPLQGPEAEVAVPLGEPLPAPAATETPDAMTAPTEDAAPETATDQ